MTGKGLRGESPELKPTVPLTDPGAALRQRLPHLDLWVWLPCLESTPLFPSPSHSPSSFPEVTIIFDFI